MNKCLGKFFHFFYGLILFPRSSSMFANVKRAENAVLSVVTVLDYVAFGMTISR